MKEKMNYSEYVGFVQETNRPSGGIKTVQTSCVNAFINNNKKVLEIGCNTGFTSINIARLTGAEVIGIDVVKNSLNAAKKKVEVENLQRVSFEKASATELPFEDETFDVVWLSNVLSFIDDKKKALNECTRVLKTTGFLIFIPIYYLKNPPEELITDVSEAISSPLTVRKKEDWISFIDDEFGNHEIVFEEDYTYIDVEDELDEYLEEVFNKPHLSSYDEEFLSTLRKKGKYFMSLFNENLKYAGYSIFILQKLKFKEETELFKSKKKN